MSIIKINEGTQTPVNTQTVGTVETQVIRLDIGSGTTSAAFTGTISAISNLATGTLASLANMVKGTVTRVEGGTLTNLVSGTFNSGTVVNNGGTVITDHYQFRHADKFSTVVSTGTNTLGTIKPAVAGSVIYITDLIVSVGTATNVEIASGGTSTPVMGTMFLNTNGGAVMNFVTYPVTASGSALVYKQSVGGPLSITCLGYVD